MGEEALTLLGYDRKGPLGSSRDRWVDNIKMKLVENFFHSLETMSFPRMIQHHEVSWLKMHHDNKACHGLDKFLTNTTYIYVSAMQ
jgi:hypothetical protein